MIILHSYIYYITPQDALCEKIFLCRHTSIFLLPESTKLGFSCLMSTMGESLIVIHYKFRIRIYGTFHSFATNPKILLQPKSFSCCILKVRCRPAAADAAGKNRPIPSRIAGILMDFIQFSDFSRLMNWLTSHYVQLPNVQILITSMWTNVMIKSFSKTHQIERKKNEIQNLI